MKNEITIVFMVAGISSRFGGKIKQFANIGQNSESLIEYSLKQALKAGFDRIIFIVGNLTEIPFKEKFGNSFNNVPISYALQKYDSQFRDKPWGTTDAICSLRGKVKGKFVICNGDDIYGENTYKILYNHLKNSDDEATIGYRLGEVIPENGKTNRGIFSVEDGYVKELKEVFNIEKSDLAATSTSINDLCSMNFFWIK